MSYENSIKLMPGDLIFVGGDAWYKEVVKFFTTYRNEEPSEMAHVAGILNNSIVSEALFRVTESKYTEWSEKHNFFEVWRNVALSKSDLLNISYEVTKQNNNFYGWWKLIAHALDGTMSKIIASDFFFFRKMLFMKDYPICSWLWAYAYYNVVGYKFTYNPNTVSPDDMYDHVCNSRDWKLIHKKVKKDKTNTKLEIKL